MLRFVNNPDGSFDITDNDVFVPGIGWLMPSQEIAASETHEFIFWDDGHLSIEDINFQEHLDMKLDHAALDLASVRQLRDFLTSPRMTELLAEQE